MNDAGTAYSRSLAGLAALLFANALAGPAGLDVVAYPLPESLLNQLKGLELVTVLLVVPLLAFAARLSRRGRAEASLVAVGPCGYAAYMSAQYVVGPSRAVYLPADLLHLVVFSASAGLTAWSWSLASSVDWPIPAHGTRRRWAALLIGFAALVLLRYVPLLTGAVTRARIPAEFGTTPAFYWSIVLLDLGLVVPATLAAASGALRGHRLTTAATHAVVGWFALVPPSVAAMALVMVARDDPHGSWPTVAMLVAVSTVSTTVAIRMFRPLLMQRRSESPPDRTAPTARTAVPADER